MSTKLNVQEINDAIEHYAYKSSTKCVKYEEIKTLVGGLYDWHPVIKLSMAKQIYKGFYKYSKEIENEPESKFKTFHAFDKDVDGSKKYRIHIFSKERTNAKRKCVWLFAGLLLVLPNNLGYCRVFRLACK